MAVPIRLILATAAASAYGAELRVGAARAEIPAAKGAYLAGYRSVQRIATAVRDPLHARVLVFKTAGHSMALVALDLYQFQSKRVAEEARRRLGLELVVFANSGTHSAPGEAADWAGGSAWRARSEDAILEAIQRASASTFAARLGAGAATVGLGYNWRSVDENGAVTMLWKNANRRPTGPLPAAAPVWRIDDEDGALRAVIFSATSQPVILGKENRQISGDYPGLAAARLESLLGAGVVCLFLQGSSGDIVPYSGEATEAGDLLAREVARTVKESNTTPEPSPSLAIYRNTYVFQHRWGGPRSISIETSTTVINQTFAIASVPGLPFVRFQLGLSDRSPVRYGLLASHAFTGTGDDAGILPTIDAAAEGGYGASYQTQVALGAGEAILDDVLANLYRSLGKLDAIPRGSLVRDMPPEGRKTH